MIEFALVAPLLILVLFGILAHGLYFAVIHGVQQVTAEAARASVAGITPAERQQIAASTINATIGAYPLLRRDRLTLNVVPAAGDPSLYDIRVTYDARHLGIWSMQGIVPLPSSTIQRTSTVRRGGL